MNNNRDFSKGIVFTRLAGLENVKSQLLTADDSVIDDTTNYSQYDYLHTDILVFDNIFFNTDDSVIAIESLIIKEHGTTLFKPDLRLFLFTDYADLDETNVVMNTASTFTTEFTADNIKAIIDVTTVEYTAITSGGAIKDAILIKNLSSPIRIMQKSKDKNLYGIAIYNSAIAGKFASDSTLQIGLQAYAT